MICNRVHENQANIFEFLPVSHCVPQIHHRSKFEVNCPFLAVDITTCIGEQERANLVVPSRTTGTIYIYYVAMVTTGLTPLYIHLSKIQHTI